LNFFFAHSKKVLFVGQIIGAIVAKDKFIARKAVKLVHVEYYDLPNRILTIDVSQEGRGTAINKLPTPS
jgi:xanthine dehydrogenase molybdopterin-binding subunit B